MLVGLLLMLAMPQVQSLAQSSPRTTTPTPNRPMLPTALPQRAINDYPQYNDLYVNDFADLLSAEDEAQIRQWFTEISAAGYQTVAVTINSFTDYDTGDATFEQFATNLFNAWGVGDSDNDGVMILLAAADREVRIEVGSSFENTLNRDLQGVINEFMLPNFRQDDYIAGLLEGSEAVYRILMRRADPSVEFPGSDPLQDDPQFTSPDAISTPSSDSNIGLLAMLGIGGAAVAGGAFTAVRRYLRLKPRPCPSCGATMKRLDEVQDDDFLDEGQRREERLQSVDYDVWKCPDCSTHQIFTYRGQSIYSECPECHYMTMGTHTQVVDPASCNHSGLRTVTHTCNHCTYRRGFEEVIPRWNCPEDDGDDGGWSSGGGSSRRSSSSSFSRSSLRSSSRSRGSFGGGRSSGGGASGKW
jgi:uncharacterized protein